jgi:CubicO group peptidase (beta-lactamase class C family)
MKKYLSFILITLCSISLSAQIATTDKQQKIDDFINYLEENNKLIGSIAITENGTSMYNNTFGYKNMPVTEAPAANQQYQIGSISKMITAVILAKLQEEGKLKFSDKLVKYFPKMPSAETITLSQMLNHTSGMQDYLIKNDTVTDWLIQPQTQNDLFAEIERQGLSFKPGTSSDYSNSAYYLLARIVEQKTKMPYADALKKYITTPLKMENTRAYKNDSKFAGVAQGYQKIGGEWTAVEDFYFYNASGVGDILSTPADLNIFMNALNSGKIIKPETLKAMIPLEKQPFGMGLMTVPFYNIIGYGHGGDTLGTHSVTSFLPDYNMSFTYTINGQDYGTNDFAIGVLSILFDKKFEYPEFSSFKATPADYDVYEGVYKNPDFPLDITITNMGTFLQGQGKGQPSFPLTQIGEKTFEFKDVNLTIVFNPESNNMLLTQSGFEVTMTRE